MMTLNETEAALASIFHELSEVKGQDRDQANAYNETRALVMHPKYVGQEPYLYEPTLNLYRSRFPGLVEACLFYELIMFATKEEYESSNRT